MLVGKNYIQAIIGRENIDQKSDAGFLRLAITLVISWSQKISI